MAKQRERIATGLSIQDISKMSIEQFSKYTPKQQRELVSRLGSAVNKRYNKLESKGIITPAPIRLEQGGGKISVKGKTGESLINEMLRAKQYLKSSISTVTGYRKLEKAIKAERDRTGYSTKKESNSVSLGLAFSYYDVLSEMDANIQAIRDKYKIVEFIADEIDNGTDYNTVLDKTMRYLEESYKESQRQYESQSVKFGDALQSDTPKRFKRKRKRRG